MESVISFVDLIVHLSKEKNFEFWGTNSFSGGERNYDFEGYRNFDKSLCLHEMNYKKIYLFVRVVKWSFNASLNTVH